ncbi:MAG: PAS domain S-box protein, partial [Paracoccus sp. (in: a-proteobacteria)]
MRRAFFIVLGGFLMAVGLFAGTIWLISADARQQIDELATANTDSTQWFLAQAEVELLAAQVAIYDAQRAAPDVQPDPLAEMRLRFDIFYSRVSTLTTSASFAPLRETPSGRGALNEMEDYLSWAALAMDGPDTELIESLPDLLAATSALRPALRRISLEGVRVFADRSDEQRQELAKAMSNLAVVVVLLFSALMLAVIALAIMFRTSRAHAIRTANTRNRLHTVIGTSIDAIIVADEDGRILDFNAAACRIYGYEASEAVGSHIMDIMVPPDKREQTQDLLRAMRQKRRAPIRIELMQSSALRRSGEVFPIEVSISSVRNREGTVMVAFVRDISERLAEQ